MKTASTTIMHVLSSLAAHEGTDHVNMWNNFEKNNLLIHSSANLQKYTFEKQVIDFLHSKNPTTFLRDISISQHMPFVPEVELIPTDAHSTVNVSTITFVRHPIDRLRSAFYYAINESVEGPQARDEIERRKEGPCACDGITFEDCVRSLMAKESCENVLPGFESDLSYVKAMSGLAQQRGEELNFRMHYSAASQNVKNGAYAFVGVTEFMEESYAVLAHRLPAFFKILSSSKQPHISARRKRWISYMTSSRRNQREAGSVRRQTFDLQELLWLETHPLIRYDMLLYNEIVALLMEAHEKLV